MAINPNFDVIGKEFVKAYYAFFDTPGKRESVAELYHNEALLSFEDDQREGKAAILDKLTNLPFKAVQHATTKIDSQPMMGGWIMVSVIGQLKVDEDGPMGYTHTFVLRPEANSYFIMHEVFRLVIHNF